MKKMNVVVVGLLLSAAARAWSSGFESDVLQASGQVSAAIAAMREAGKTAAQANAGAPSAAEIQTVSLSRIDQAKVLVLNGVCTKKKGWWLFKRDKSVACFAVKFDAYAQAAHGAQRIEKALLAMPNETQEETQAIIDELSKLGGTHNATLTYLRKPVAIGEITGDKGDVEEIYLVAKIVVSFVIAGDGVTVSGTNSYSFLSFK